MHVSVSMDLDGVDVDYEQMNVGSCFIVTTFE
jgi:hypothetical protein